MSKRPPTPNQLAYITKLRQELGLPALPMPRYIWQASQQIDKLLEQAQAKRARTEQLALDLSPVGSEESTQSSKGRLVETRSGPVWYVDSGWTAGEWNAIRRAMSKRESTP